MQLISFESSPLITDVLKEGTNLVYETLNLNIISCVRTKFFLNNGQQLFIHELLEMTRRHRHVQVCLCQS